MRKSILIIGGMGPQASLLLHKKIINAAIDGGTADNKDFPLIYHVSIPVPDFISDTSKKQAALSMIKEKLTPLKNIPLTASVIACNTAHLIYDEISQVTNVPPTSLLAMTKQCVFESRLKKVGLLGSPTTIQANLYDAAICLRTKEQQKTEQIIREVLAGKAVDRDELLRQIRLLESMGCERVILGCTELSIMNEKYKFSNVIDPLDLAAKKLMKSTV